MSDPNAASAVALVLGAAGDPVALRDALDGLARLPRAEAVAQIDDALGDALAALAAERRGDQRHAAEVLGGLAESSPPLHRALHRALAHANARLRWGAAYTLGRALPPGPELWPAALETLALDDGDQRWAAAELACAIARRHLDVHAAIRDQLGSASATRRKMCLYCLRDLGDPEAPQLATALLADPDAGVRLAALATVARVQAGSDAALLAAEPVAAMLDADGDAGVRRAAAATLGKLGASGPAVLAALRSASTSEDPSLARAARGALVALGAPG